MARRAAVLYSGGKDSTLALHRVHPLYRVECLVTFQPRSEESMLFHYPNTRLVELQARALELPIIIRRSSDTAEDELEALEDALRQARKDYGVEGVVTGAVKSRYQQEKFSEVCRKLGLEVVSPLWMRDEVELLREVVETGIVAIITRIGAYPLKLDLLGRQIDDEVISYLAGLRHMLNPSGEGGEYETFVIDAPLFKKRIGILKKRIVGRDYDASLIIEEAFLEDKTPSKRLNTGKTEQL